MQFLSEEFQLMNIKYYNHVTAYYAEDISSVPIV